VMVALPLGSPMAALAIDLPASVGHVLASCTALGTPASGSSLPPQPVIASTALAATAAASGLREEMGFMGVQSC
jgi:hypothetical protein